MKKNYADIGLGDSTLQIHYLRGGTGAPLILLHPSPLSASWLQPQCRALIGQFDCIAPDTPGYGGSDPLPEQPLNLQPYVLAVASFLDALGLDRTLFYGSATGAQIAIEFAKTFPDRCDGLLLENVAFLTTASVSRSSKTTSLT